MSENEKNDSYIIIESPKYANKFKFRFKVIISDKKYPDFTKKIFLISYFYPRILEQ